MSNELIELPKDWEWASVDSLAIVMQYGTSAKTSEEFDGIPVLRMGNIVNGEIDCSNLKYLPRSHNEFPNLFLESGDVLFNRTNSAELVGKTAVFREQKLPCSFASYLIRIRLSQYYPELFSWYLNSTFGRAWIASVVSQQVGQANVSGAKLKELKIPVPPFNEQKRIVAKIEELNDRHQRAKQALEAIPELCDRFRQSVLAAAFRGDLTADWREENPDVEPASVLLERINQERVKNELEQHRKAAKRPSLSKPENFNIPENWEIVLSHDLFSFVTSGSRGWAKYYSNDGAIFIRVGNLDRGTIYLDLTDIQKVNPPTGAEGTRTEVQSGDILISITADIGMIGIIPPDMPEAYINQHVALARPLKCFSREYLAWYLASSQDGFKQFQQLQRGATKTGLGLDDIRSVWVPFPSLLEQKEIVRRIEQFFRVIQVVEDEHEKVKNQLDHLNQSILAKAFRGELVEQDPNDEPASVLLDRIRAEREKLGRLKKTSKKSKP